MLIEEIKEERDAKGSADNFVVMYHGAVVPGRDVERLIELVSVNCHIRAVILGNAENSYRDKLEKIAAEYGITNRILFHPAVPLNVLWKYVGAVDVGMILARATCKNHLYSLPNKLFENIQAGTPVICPAYPAFKQIVEKYENGLMCDPEDMDEMNRCVEKLRNDKELYTRIKENTMRAREKLNWEKERIGLHVAYSDIFARQNNSGFAERDTN